MEANWLSRLFRRPIPSRTPRLNRGAPLDDGKFTVEDYARLDDLLLRVTFVGECPACRADNWGWGESLVSTPVYSARSDVTITNRSYIHVPLVCHGCGYTILFNAVLLGFLTPQGEITGGA